MSDEKKVELRERPSVSDVPIPPHIHDLSPTRRARFFSQVHHPPSRWRRVVNEVKGDPEVYEVPELARQIARLGLGEFPIPWSMTIRKSLQPHAVRVLFELLVLDRDEPDTKANVIMEREFTVYDIAASNDADGYLAYNIRRVFLDMLHHELDEHFARDGKRLVDPDANDVVRW